jgi:hypothetical protein
MVRKKRHRATHAFAQVARFDFHKFADILT